MSAATLCLAIFFSDVMNTAGVCGSSVYYVISQHFSVLYRQRANQHGSALRSSKSKQKWKEKVLLLNILINPLYEACKWKHLHFFLFFFSFFFFFFILFSGQLASSRGISFKILNDKRTVVQKDHHIDRFAPNTINSPVMDHVQHPPTH